MLVYQRIDFTRSCLAKRSTRSFQASPLWPFTCDVDSPARPKADSSDWKAARRSPAREVQEIDNWVFLSGDPNGILNLWAQIYQTYPSILYTIW